MPSSSSRIAILTIVALALCAGVALTEAATIGGVVQRVDLPSRTVYFIDGTAMILEPRACLFTDGREIQLADVQPGWTLLRETSAAATAPGVIMARPATSLSTASIPPPQRVSALPRDVAESGAIQTNQIAVVSRGPLAR